MKSEFRKNEIFDLKIDGYGSQGEGVAHLDGLTVFIKGAIRGELCRVKLMKVGKGIAWGKLEAVLSPSAARITPDCPHFPKCGGCSLRHMTYEEELHFKKQKVTDALQRIGGVSLSVSDIHGAEQTLRYRNKAQFPVSGQNGIAVGFYRSGSHDVIDVPSCAIQHPMADIAARTVKQWMTENDVPAYDEMTHSGIVRHVYVRTPRNTEILVCVICNAKKLPYQDKLVAMLRGAVPNCVGIVLGINREKTNVILGDSYKTLWGQDFLEDCLCGLRFQLSVPSFFQVNAAQTDVLYGKALEFAQLTGSETVVDLYCGIGTISLVMAKHAAHVIGAEIVPQAIDDARQNAVRNGISNVEFICADAKLAAQELVSRNLHPNVVCVDPPRKGMNEAVIAHIVSMQPDRIVYVSCDPATLARDLKRFESLGYACIKAEAVDMFPRTYHIEVACWMSRISGG